MVHSDGSPVYPERRCDTFSYELSKGPEGEQELYDEASDYIRLHYNRARGLNRSAGPTGHERFPAQDGKLYLCIDAVLGTST